MANLTGKTFGKLTVVERDYSKSSERGIYWITQCSCGNTKSIRSTNMTRGRTVSCGCYNKEKRTNVKPHGEANFNKTYADYQRGANKRGYSFSLTKDQFREITSKKCHYCGIEPKEYTKYGGNPNGLYLHNGIERVNNNLGYEYENCVPCCKTGNRAKDTMTLVEFERWIRRLYHHINHTDPNAIPNIR